MATDPASRSASGRTRTYPPVTAVLFDFDDTLINSYSARLDALQRVFTGAGISDPTAEAFFRDMVGRQLEDELRPLESREGLQPQELFSGYRRTYWTKEPGLISLFPGVRGVLEEFRSRGLKMGIVTQKAGCSRWTVEGWGVPGAGGGGSKRLLLRRSGVESVTNHKPHPESVLLALQGLGPHRSSALWLGIRLRIWERPGRPAAGAVTPPGASGCQQQPHADGRRLCGQPTGGAAGPARVPSFYSRLTP